MWPLTTWMEKQCALVMVSVFSALLKREWGQNYNSCLRCQVYVSLFGTGCLENNLVQPKHISLSSSVKLLFAICSILWGLSSLDMMDHQMVLNIYIKSLHVCFHLSCHVFSITQIRIVPDSCGDRNSLYVLVMLLKCMINVSRNGLRGCRGVHYSGVLS